MQIIGEKVAQTASVQPLDLSGLVSAGRLSNVFSFEFLVLIINQFFDVATLIASEADFIFSLLSIHLFSYRSLVLPTVLFSYYAYALLIKSYCLLSLSSSFDFECSLHVYSLDLT